MALNASTETFHAFESSPKRWYWALRLLLALATILGNAPLIYVLVRRRKLRQNLPNRFILSLSVADVCVGLFISPPELLCTYWLACSRKIQLAMYEVFVHTSSLCLCIVTWDRYRSVTRPLTYPVVIAVKQYLIPILVCWLLPLMVALLHFTYLFADSETEATAMRILATVETVMFFGVPCAVLPLAYLHIVCIIRRHRKGEQRQKDQVDFNYSAAISDSDEIVKATENTAFAAHVISVPSGPQSELLSVALDSNLERTSESRPMPQTIKPRHPNHDQSITVLGLVILLFVACSITASYLHLNESFSWNWGQMTHSYMNLSWLLILANSALNPFVYGFVKKDIKIEMKILFTCRRNRQ